ncbi:MAG: DUF6316 family protein [Porticoccus sp.]|nr:DUF6316 family protein [Porticoccus sp.]
MVSSRNGENEERQLPIRSQRFFKLHNFWFFATREGAAVGPFDAQEGAANAVNDYIEFMQKADDSARDFFTPGAKFVG